MLEVASIHKAFGATVAVQEVSFSAQIGEPIALLGRNGAGKTSTLRLLAGLYTPTRGSITFDGHAISKSQDYKRHMGFMPDTPPLYPGMQVQEFLHHVAALRGLRSKALRLAVDAVIERCSLEPVQRKLLAHLSRGYAQRVSLAQAIVHDPKLLLLDEPTIGLDPEQIVHFRSVLKKLAKHTVLVFSSHILSEVQEICSKVVVISDGISLPEIAVANLKPGQSVEQYFFESMKDSAMSGVVGAQ